MRPIDADELLTAFPVDDEPMLTKSCVRMTIQHMPTIESDVQPVRKGCFIGTEYDGYADGSPVFYEWKCSECGCIFEDEEPTYNYCPNCGADMRGEQNDG